MSKTVVEFVYAPWHEWPAGVRHAFAKNYADKLFPRGCMCSDCNSGGDCDWCQAYYAKFADRNAISSTERGWEMGSERFDHMQKEPNVKKAFAAAQQEALYEYGHGGHTGSLAEKFEFEVRNEGNALTIKEAAAFADKDLDENNHAKRGPAWAVAIRSDDSPEIIGWMFYGYASS